MGNDDVSRRAFEGKVFLVGWLARGRKKREKKNLNEHESHPRKSRQQAILHVPQELTKPDQGGYHGKGVPQVKKKKELAQIRVLKSWDPAGRIGARGGGVLGRQWIFQKAVRPDQTISFPARKKLRR